MSHPAQDLRRRDCRTPDEVAHGREGGEQVPETPHVLRHADPKPVYVSPEMRRVRNNVCAAWSIAVGSARRDTDAWKGSLVSFVELLDSSHGVQPCTEPLPQISSHDKCTCTCAARQGCDRPAAGKLKQTSFTPWMPDGPRCSPSLAAHRNTGKMCRRTEPAATMHDYFIGSATLPPREPPDKVSQARDDRKKRGIFGRTAGAADSPSGSAHSFETRLISSKFVPEAF